VSEQLSHSRWTSHPALKIFGVVFLARDLILALVALGGLVGGGIATHDTLAIVALGLGALALAGVVVSSIVGQRRADASMALPTPGALPARRNPLRAALRERPSAQAAAAGAVAEQLSGGRKLAAEMRDAQAKGTWDDEGWAFRKRVEAWTERTADVLAEGGREDLASALADVEAPPQPPFEALLEGHSPSYARLVGLLDGRIALLEESLR
jgi:hypothetical protein